MESSQSGEEIVQSHLEPKRARAGQTLRGRPLSNWCLTEAHSTREIAEFAEPGLEKKNRDGMRWVEF